jgi:hypothetical protein
VVAVAAVTAAAAAVAAVVINPLIALLVRAHFICYRTGDWFF